MTAGSLILSLLAIDIFLGGYLKLAAVVIAAVTFLTTRSVTLHGNNKPLTPHKDTVIAIEAIFVVILILAVYIGTHLLIQRYGLL